MNLTKRAFLKGAGAAALATMQFKFDSARADVLAARDPQSATDYDLDPAVTYLNHASIGTQPRAVRRAHAAYLEICESNPWLYMWGPAWEPKREALRAAAAAWLGTTPKSLAITHNTTEGFNIAAQGLSLGPGDEVLFSSLNHPGASVAWQHVARRDGFAVRQFEFPLEESPGLTADDVLALYLDALSDRTRVLVFPDVDNLVGIRHPVTRLAQAARARGVDYVMVDGAQGAGMLETRVDEFDVDLYACSGHKWLQGPKGTGFAFLSARLRQTLEPMWVTWGQKDWRDSVRIFEDYGTRDLPAVLALHDAITLHRRVPIEARETRLAALHAHARARVDSEAALHWRSPRTFEHGAGLFSVSRNSERSADSFARMFDQGFVFRAFAEPDMIRLSPNVMNDSSDIDRFFDVLLQA